MSNKLMSWFAALKLHRYFLPVFPVLVVLVLYLIVAASGSDIARNGVVHCEELFEEYNREAKFWISILVLSAMFAPIINFSAVAAYQDQKIRVVAAVCSYLLLASAAIALPKGKSVNQYASAAAIIHFSDLDSAQKQDQCKTVFVDRMTDRFQPVEQALSNIKDMEIGRTGPVSTDPGDPEVTEPADAPAEEPGGGTE